MPLRPSQPSQRELPRQSRSPERPSIFEKLTDHTQFTGAHKQRFDRDGRGRGKVGRTEDHEMWATEGMKVIVNRSRPRTAQDHPMYRGGAIASPPRTISSSEDEQKRQDDLFAKLTDPKQFPGAHKHRFDETGAGRGKAGRKEDFEAWAEIGMSHIVNRSRPRTDADHPMYRGGAIASPPRSASPKRRARTPQKSPRVFEKLTDSKQYVGVHRARFDDQGQGRGIAGRAEEHERWEQVGMSALMRDGRSDSGRQGA